MRKWVIILLIVVGILWPARALNAQTMIMSSTEIIESGAYKLGSTINGEIIITAEQVKIYNPDGYTVIGNADSDYTTGEAYSIGIWVKADDVELHGLKVKNFDLGILFENADYGVVENCSLSECADKAIVVAKQSNYIHISDNTVESFGEHGISLWHYCNQNIVERNKIMNSGLIGIYLYDASNQNRVINNYIKNYPYQGPIPFVPVNYGIIIRDSYDNEVTGNEVVSDIENQYAILLDSGSSENRGSSNIFSGQSNGCQQNGNNISLQTTQISQAVQITLTDFSLYQNYPNPFNGITRINYSLAKECQVKLRVYDTLGREMVVLVDANQSPGNYSVAWQADVDVSSGVYILRLETSSGFTSIRQMMYLK